MSQRSEIERELVDLFAAVLIADVRQRLGVADVTPVGHTRRRSQPMTMTAAAGTTAAGGR